MQNTIAGADQEAQGPEAARYEIVVEGHLDGRWARQFGGLALSRLPNDQTLLAGWVADQPALHGVLARIRDLGLTLVSVTRCTDKEQSDKEQSDKEQANKEQSDKEQSEKRTQTQ